VRIGVEGDRNSGMTKHVSGDLWMNPLAKHDGRCRVPEIVDTYPWEPGTDQKWAEGSAEHVPRFQRSADRGREDIVMVLP
jgi:hypothetical protein